MEGEDRGLLFSHTALQNLPKKVVNLNATLKLESNPRVYLDLDQWPGDSNATLRGSFTSCRSPASQEANSEEVKGHKNNHSTMRSHECLEKVLGKPAGKWKSDELTHTIK